MTRTAHRSRPGFTLVELLVVIGIIVLLISILLPTAGRVRVSAQTASTKASMAAIGAAIERYAGDKRVWPGLVSNSDITAGTVKVGTQPITMSENLVLTLTGGFRYNETTPSEPVVNLDDVGKGPLNLSSNPVRRTRGAAYIDLGNLVAERGTQNWANTGIARDALDMVGVPAGQDSQAPEFLDAYSQRRPILYLRARNGGATYATEDTDSGSKYMADTDHYDRRHLLKYQRTARDEFPGDFNFPNTADHTTDFYNSWSRYLNNPNIANTPRGKDKYILISAGADRIFGTRDDIFYGG